MLFSGLIVMLHGEEQGKMDLYSLVQRENLWHFKKISVMVQLVGVWS